jgi:hypothetical protein
MSINIGFAVVQTFDLMRTRMESVALDSFTPKRYRVSNDFRTELAEEARPKTKSRTRSDTLVVWLHFSNG